jgi:hypothetical protein
MYISDHGARGVGGGRRGAIGGEKRRAIWGEKFHIIAIYLPAIRGVPLESIHSPGDLLCHGLVWSFEMCCLRDLVNFSSSLNRYRSAACPCLTQFVPTLHQPAADT